MDGNGMGGVGCDVSPESSMEEINSVLTEKKARTPKHLVYTIILKTSYSWKLGECVRKFGIKSDMKRNVSFLENTSLHNF